MPTEFINVIDTDSASGTDYSGIVSFESSTSTDLTASNTLVFSHGGENGTVGSSLTGKTSGATGTIVALTSTQILIDGIGGTPFQSGEQVYSTIDTDYVVISDAGDSAILIAECRADVGTADGNVTFNSTTTDATHYIELRRHADEIGVNQDKWDTANYRIVLTTSGRAIKNSITNGTGYFRVKNIQLEVTSDEHMIDADHSTSSSLTGEIIYDGCIMKCPTGTAGSKNVFGLFGFDNTNSAAVKLVVINCLFLDDYLNESTLRYSIITTPFTAGHDYTIIFYNCTAIGMYGGYRASAIATKQRLYNCISYGGRVNESADADWNNFDYNQWGVTEAESQGTNGNDSVTFTFETTPPADLRDGSYKLATGDTGAKDKAAELDGDSAYAFQTDVLGNDRGTSTWDAGYHQVTPTATVDQEGFRFRNDDGTETAATWRQTQDVIDSIAKSINVRLRVLIDATSGDPPTSQFQLEYKENGDAATEYRKIPL